jgi:diguanylate cyclase (GGDEF)-like protein
MLSLRSSSVSPPVLGAMRHQGRALRRSEPARMPAEEITVVSAPTALGEMPLQDWAALFDAVTERLQRLAGRCDTTPAAGHALRLPLQECVDALRQLHERAEESLQRSAQLRAELAAAQALLAGTRTELAHTQIGRRRAEHAAAHDALTQLPNRSHFHERLAGSLAGAHASMASLAVLYLDLDGFKRINDEHGHDTGDATLCIVAQRLACALRAEDTVCRLGGDEFACLLVAPASREQLSKLVCKLFDAVAAPLQVGALQLSVQPSIGIAMYPDDGVTGATLLQRADAAMFRAKRRQQGYAFFERPSDL